MTILTIQVLARAFCIPGIETQRAAGFCPRGLSSMPGIRLRSDNRAG
jgi:hypothetical protein